MPDRILGFCRANVTGNSLGLAWDSARINFINVGHWCQQYLLYKMVSAL